MKIAMTKKMLKVVQDCAPDYCVFEVNFIKITPEQYCRLIDYKGPDWDEVNLDDGKIKVIRIEYLEDMYALDTYITLKTLKTAAAEADYDYEKFKKVLYNIIAI